MKHFFVFVISVLFLMTAVSLSAKEKNEFDNAPDWVREASYDHTRCVLVIGLRSKTDKMTIERLVEQADLELCRNMSTIFNGLVNDKKMINIGVHTINESACALTEKRFLKDVWKSPKEIFALVCLPNEKEIMAEIEKRHFVTGKYWSDASREKMSLNDAKLYCENLKEGGFDDWRLPNIDELRSLVKNCKDTIAGGTCQITDKCKTDSCFAGALSKSDCWCPKNQAQYSKLGDKGTFWSDSYYSLSMEGGCALSSYVLNFDSGGITDSHFLMVDGFSKSDGAINCVDFRNMPNFNNADKLENETIYNGKLSTYFINHHYVRCVR
jgi:hypothetical protein